MYIPTLPNNIPKCIFCVLDEWAGMTGSQQGDANFTSILGARVLSFIPFQ